MWAGPGDLLLTNYGRNDGILLLRFGYKKTVTVFLALSFLSLLEPLPWMEASCCVRSVPWRGSQSKGLTSLANGQQGAVAPSPTACEELLPANRPRQEASLHPVGPLDDHSAGGILDVSSC